MIVQLVLLITTTTVGINVLIVALINMNQEMFAKIVVQIANNAKIILFAKNVVQPINYIRINAKINLVLLIIFI